VRLINLHRGLLFLAFTINFAAVLLLIIIWRNIFWGYLLSVVLGFILGVVVGSFRGFLALMLSSYFSASFLSTLIYIFPTFLRSNIIWFQVQVGVLGAASAIAFNSFVVIPFTFLSGVFGLYVYHKLVKVSKFPKIFD